MVKKRQSNVELLRIICMLFIVAGHLILAHEKAKNLTDGDEIIRLFIKSFTSVSVNAFVLISGYFGLVLKKDRFINLFIQTFSYSVLLLLISIAIGWHTFDLKKDIVAFFPILTNLYWFVTSYAVLYVISPWLNQSINNITKIQYKQILIVGFIIIYVWPTISYLFNTRQFIGDAGYGIVNFSYLYLLGRYLKFHYAHNRSLMYYLGGFILFGSILFVCQFSLSCILGFEYSSWFSYNTVFVFMGALCLFLLFNKLNIESSSINYWAKPCLAVYLIHFNPYIWGKFCNLIGVSDYHGIHYILLIIILPIIIYFCCSIIELCRIRLMSGIEKRLMNHFTTCTKAKEK